ncbi:MAG: hypothetical protein AABY22_12390 [Nanoarchaeota archaeon]
MDTFLQKQQRHECTAWAIKYLGGSCAKCKSSNELEFDHIISKDKKFEISQKLLSSKKVLLKELKKCQLLCRKCHVKKTNFGKNMKKPILIRLEKYQYDWTVKASKKKGLSFSGFIRWLIERIINK